MNKKEASEKPPDDCQGPPTHKRIPRWLVISIAVVLCLALMIVVLALVIGSLFFASQYVGTEVDHVQFITVNFLSVLVFFAIVVQAAIYFIQWIAMQNGLKRTDTVIREMRAALFETRRQTAIAKQSLIAGHRAFVSVQFRHDAVKTLQSNEIIQWRFTPTWSNAGDTPTRNCINHTSIKVFDGAIPAEFNFPDVWSNGEQQHVPFNIAPKGVRDGQAVDLSVETIDEIVAGEKSALMWGWTEYNDVFPNTKRHVTRFAVRIIAGGNPRIPERVSFYYAFIPRYNYSDEECDAQGHPHNRHT